MRAESRDPAFAAAHDAIHRHLAGLLDPAHEATHNQTPTATKASKLDNEHVLIPTIRAARDKGEPAFVLSPSTGALSPSCMISITDFSAPLSLVLRRGAQSCCVSPFSFRREARYARFNAGPNPCGSRFWPDIVFLVPANLLLMHAFDCATQPATRFKSLLLKILPLSSWSSKICRQNLPKLLILKDRCWGEGVLATPSPRAVLHFQR